VSVVKGTVALRKVAANGTHFIVGFKSERDQFLVDRDRGPMPIEVWAVTNATLCVIDVLKFDSDNGQHPQLHKFLLDLFQSELASVQDTLFRLGRMSAVERVASFVFEIATRHGRPFNEGLRCHLPMSRTEIGDHLGLKVETVSRALGVLKAGGVVRFLNRNDVIIPNVRSLRAVIEGFENDD
jgi:CRP/FNR family transcriptional regulator